jgi:sugar lactone lactonase YvrE
MPVMPAELLLDLRLQLGEGPAWDARRRVLYFVDIHAGGLHVFDPRDETHHLHPLGEPLGCLAPTAADGLILALQSGFACFDPADGTLTRLVSPEPHLPGNRFNDGKCDPAGRFLAGTMDDAEQAACGSLYSLAPDGRLKTLLTGLRISNGLTWSPDYRTFYFIDTPTRLVMAYDYDLETGDLANPRPVVRVPEALGWPDGMTADAEGMLWVALWGGAQVTRWDPLRGRLLASIRLPALNVTSCVFGGAALGELYITSARKGMRADQLKDYPLSGGLFCLATDTSGLPTFAFGGG